MRAWIFQDAKRKAELGDDCPWSVGWYNADGKRKGKKVGSKSLAEKFQRKVEGELAAGICTVGRKRTTWADFRKQFVEIALAGKARGTVVEYANALDGFERLIKLGYVDAITRRRSMSSRRSARGRTVGREYPRGRPTRAATQGGSAPCRPLFPPQRSTKNCATCARR